MAYVDVFAWSPEHVMGWLRGFHQSLESTPMDQLMRNRVNGRRLLLLASQDLIELIPGIKVEALQAIIRGISKLREMMDDNSKYETLQLLTLNLNCSARYLCNQIIQAEQSPRILPVSTTLTTPMTGNSKNRFDFAKVDSNMQINQSTKQRVSLETLDCVSIIVDQIRRLVCWINSTEWSKFVNDFKNIVLRVAIEVTSTAQRDQFVEQPNDILKKTSRFLADYCEWVVLAIVDPDFFQPCWLDVVSVKKKPEEDDFGIVLQTSTLDSLTIEDVKFSSPAHRSGRIANFDEIVQVDYQTVVGWPPDQVMNLIKEYTSEIILTIKKKPMQSLNPSIVVLRPYAIPLKRILSHNSESLTVRDELTVNKHGVLERQSSFVEHIDDSSCEGEVLEPPKEPKGPVYPGLKTNRSERELKRRMSISGDISDALVDLSLADSLPIPTLEKTPPSTENIQDKSKLARITKETLTKSVSHDTAKLYLHTLSIDRKHLWMPKSPKTER